MKRGSPTESDDEILLSPKKKKTNNKPTSAHTTTSTRVPSRLPRPTTSKRPQPQSKAKENDKSVNAFDVLMGKVAAPPGAERKQVSIKSRMKRKQEKRIATPKRSPRPIPLDEDSDGRELSPLGDCVMDSLRLHANREPKASQDAEQSTQLFQDVSVRPLQQPIVDDTHEDPPVSSPVLEASPPIVPHYAAGHGSAFNGDVQEDPLVAAINVSSPLTEQSCLTPLQEPDVILSNDKGMSTCSADAVAESPRSPTTALSELTDLPTTPEDRSVSLEDALSLQTEVTEPFTQPTEHPVSHTTTPTSVGQPDPDISTEVIQTEKEPQVLSEPVLPPLLPTPSTTNQVQKRETVPEDEQPPQPQPAGPSKPSSSSSSKPRLSKRKPARPPPITTRLTRSTSQRQKNSSHVAEPERGSSPLSSPPSSPTQLEPPASSKSTNEQKRASAIPKATVTQNGRVAGSSKALLLAGPSTDSNRTISKPNSAPSSPSKLARSTSMFVQSSLGVRPHYHPSESEAYNALHSALNKLHEPPPPRPNTSMGFNRDDPQDDNEEGEGDQASKFIDDSELPDSSRPGHKRASTTGQLTSSRKFLSTQSTSSAASSSSSSSTTSKRPTLAKKPGGMQTKLTFGVDSRLTMLCKPATNGLTRGRAIANLRNGGGRMLPPALHRTKVSKDPSLPSVQASPQKGANDDDDDVMIVDDADARPLPSLVDSLKGIGVTDNDEDVVMGDPPEADTQSTGSRDKGKGRDTSSSFISPHGSERRTARLRSHSASQPNLYTPPDGGEGSGDQSQLESMSRSKSFSQHTLPAVSTPASAVLKDCTVFVDVRTEDGDNAGDLFIGMLKDMGAKVLGTAGRTCTHIIFKDGLISTVKSYRSFKENPPHIVGVGWVAQCAQEQARVDESKFFVDTSEINIAAGNKRRKSMIPKHFAYLEDEPDITPGWRDVDKSTEGSVHSVDDEDLPPLERARRRKSFLPARS
jgi:hypothetical protein